MLSWLMLNGLLSFSYIWLDLFGGASNNNIGTEAEIVSGFKNCILPEIYIYIYIYIYRWGEEKIKEMISNALKLSV